MSDAGEAASVTSKIPDIMNDVKFNPNPKWKGKGAEEVDTCRICRGEGTRQEPLFHPCKCSGSIKFVHQECLMEWLSHSQKKHCELCKTSFRFTKLYHPHMPQTLPTAVFLRRAAMHSLKTVLTWCRVALVVCIWLFWLPWSMRFVWWGLFWIADGGWACQLTDHSNMARVLEKLKDLKETNATTLAPGSPASEGDVLTNFVQNHNSTFFKALRSLLTRHGGNATQSLSVQAPSPSLVPGNVAYALGHGSLLSNAPFFQSLTPSPAFNKFIMDVLEGQVITLLVVVVVVLIFLIREWVVQQQPAANPNVGPLPAAAAAIARDARAEADGRVRDQPRNEDGVDSRQDNLPTEDAAQWESDQTDTQDENGNNVPHDRDNPNAEPALHFDTSYVPVTEASEDENSGSGFEQEEIRNLFNDSRSEPQPSLLEDQGAGDFSSSQHTHSRPVMPFRTQSSLATEIQRDLEESSSPRNTHRESHFSEHANEGGSDNSEASWQRLSSSENSQSNGDGIYTGQSESSRPQLRRKPKTERLSSGFHESIEPSSSSDHQPGEESRDNSYEDNAMWEEEAEASGASSLGQPPSPIAPLRATPELADRSLFDRSDTPEASTTGGPSEEGEEEEEPSQDIEMQDQFAKSWTDRVLDWLWGDLVPADPTQRGEENEERVVDDLANEAPFVPFVDAHPDNRGHAEENEDEVEDEVQDPEVVAAAARAGINPNEADGIDDAEDLEGIMELLGMQGPLMGLVQNALFCAVLVSATVTTAVWFPYVWGKLVLIPLADPAKWLIKIPLNFVAGAINICIDFALFLTFSMLYWVAALVSLALIPLTGLAPLGNHKTLTNIVSRISDSALLRITSVFLSDQTNNVDYITFSLNSHVALSAIRQDLATSSKATWSLFEAGYHEIAHDFAAGPSLDAFYRVAQAFISFAVNQTSAVLISLATWTSSLFRSSSAFSTSTSWKSREPLVELDLAHWTTTDRVVTILIGYIFFSIFGAFYLKRGSNFSTSEQGRRVENLITEILNQAGGILKVILIISIEMIAFPLYCGALLDLALLPLFPANTASVQSRIQFTIASPWTSAFLHWFIGTCYMFHFALFVSMCRKIMRNGVLYFIRDPDDPTFHPVRDVLERNVSSQLRKIGFSAVVYGALVIICLGSVVWTVSHFSLGIFPIRWSSSPSVLEFPIDLLLYNFLAPFLIHLFKPSKGLHAAYDWWFKKCARALRLSHFLFGEEHRDEQGNGSNQGEHNLPKDGKFVRAPASDQVRIPKGYKVFLEVDEENNRVDGFKDEDQGIHGKSNENFVKVYIPPWFRIRISLFVVALWALTAAIGISVTIGPLLFGRWVISLVVSDMKNVSDIYTFCVGFCSLGGFVYAMSSQRGAIKKAKNYVRIDTKSLLAASRVLEALFQRSLRIIYTYSAFALLIPAVLALLLEFYFVMPLQACLASSYSTPKSPKIPDSAVTTNTQHTTTLHTIFFLQDWALGVLYLRIAIRLVLWSAESRPARALRAIVAQGWTNPNAYLATRCFIVPILVTAAVALLFPGMVGYVAAMVVSHRFDETGLIQVRRLAYPAVLAAGLVVWMLLFLLRALSNWRRVIRDEVYLIGERLHNFGEQKPPRPNATASHSPRRRTGALRDHTVQ